MTPALREALIAADARLRQGLANDARAGLHQFAAANPDEADAPEYHLLLGESAFQSGDAESARAHASRAVAARADWFEAQHLLGRALSDLGLAEQALAHLQRAVELRPTHPRAIVNLASVQRAVGRIDEALAGYADATRLDPGNVTAWRGLAETLQARGDHETAIDAWMRWSALVPNRAEALMSIGGAYLRARRWNAAEQAFASAAGEPAADHRANVLLGFVRRERGDTAGAVDAYRAAAEQAPDAVTPAVAAALMLPQIYRSGDNMLEWRARFEQGLQQLESRWPRFETMPDGVWDLDWSNFYLAYQGLDDLPLQSAYADLIGRLTSRAAPECSPSPSSDRSNRARIRVGFASSHFRRCTVAAYFESWLTRLDRSRFEVHAFHFGSEADDTTALLRRSVHRFDHLRGGVRNIAAAIRNAHLDVLVYPELGMDGRDVTLSTLRLAPVQCAAWGHPVTTGSSAIDYFFSCEPMEPSDAAGHYRERLLLLPGLGTSYRCPPVRVATRAEFGLPQDARLYAWPQSLFKIHPDNDAVFGSVLETDRAARAVFCADLHQPATFTFRKRVERALADRAVDPARVVWQPMRPEDDFRAMLSVCDVLVDTLHWSGGNTSLDALAAGLPIVTVRGRFLRGRQSAAMLATLGLDELIASDASELVRIATRVAHDNAPFRTRIADRRALLFERDEPLRALERHLEEIARA